MHTVLLFFISFLYIKLFQCIPVIYSLKRVNNSWDVLQKLFYSFLFRKKKLIVFYPCFIYRANEFLSIPYRTDHITHFSKKILHLKFESWSHQTYIKISITILGNSWCWTIDIPLVNPVNHSSINQITINGQTNQDKVHWCIGNQ